MRTEIITVETTGERLDKFLVEELEGISRTKIRALIDNGKVLVDGKIPKASLRLEGGEQITVTIDEIETELEHIVPESIPLDIVYEDADLVVINKPAGMVVHPGKNNTSGTLANALAYHFKQLSNINGSLRPGIVHRLDMNTSGLILVARNNLAHMNLARQFEQRQVHKTYLGLTWGEWLPESGVIDIGIRRHRADPTRYMAAVDGRSAVTEFELVEHLHYLSMLRFYPRTGRTHQIRVHAAHMGFAIFADEVYNGGRNRTRGYIPEVKNILLNWLDSVNRHALHAHQIEFSHPRNSGKMHFEIPLPADMEFLVEQARQLNV